MTRLKQGFTLVEVMIVVAIIALLAAIAIPNVLRGRTSANESAAVGNCRALMSSLEMYRSVNNLYPAAWAVQPSAMYPAAPSPAFGPPSFNATSPVTVQGYTYTYTAGAAPVNSYTFMVNPQTLNTTGTRSFYVDQTGVIRHCIGTMTTAAANAGDATIDQPPTAACL